MAQLQSFKLDPCAEAIRDGIWDSEHLAGLTAESGPIEGREDASLTFLITATLDLGQTEEAFGCHLEST